jgi:hypothetical protein
MVTSTEVGICTKNNALVHTVVQYVIQDLGNYL